MAMTMNVIRIGPNNINKDDDDKRKTTIALLYRLKVYSYSSWKQNVQVKRMKKLIDKVN